MKAKWLDRVLEVNSGYFTLCTTEKKFARILKHLRIPKKDWPGFTNGWHCDATTHHFENREDFKVSSVVCLRLRNGVSYPQIAALIVHEAVHIWQKTRDDYGERSPSPEFEAYAIQNITQRLLEEYQRQAAK